MQDQIQDAEQVGTNKQVGTDPLVWFTDGAQPVAVRKSLVLAVIPQSTGRTFIDYRSNTGVSRGALVDESAEEVRRLLGE